MTSKEALNDLKKRNEALKNESHFHIGSQTMEVIQKLVERDTYKSVKFKTEHTGFCPNCELSVDTTTWRDKRTDEIKFVIPKNKFCENCGQRILKEKL